MKTILFFLLYLILVCIVLSTAQAQCNLTDAELKARGMYRDTTAYTWIVNDQATCISVAFGRKRDGEIVIRDRAGIEAALEREPCLASPEQWPNSGAKI